MRLLLIFQLLFFSTTSLSKPLEIPDHVGPTDIPQESIDFFLNSGRPGFLTAFLGDPALRSNINQLTFFQSSPDEISARYIIGNYTGKDLTFRLICLADYEISDCNILSKSRNRMLKIKHEQLLETAIHLAPLMEGSHDLLVLLINDYDHELNQAWRGIIHVASKNTNGNYKHPAISHRDMRNGHKISLNHNHNLMNFISEPNLDSKKNIIIHVRNGDSRSANYLLVPILIAEEEIYKIEIPHNAEKFQLDANTSTAIPFQAPSAGTLFLVTIQNPFSDLEHNGLLVEAARSVFIDRFNLKR